MADRLYRSREDAVIGGVAGGVAEALDVDPSIVRVVWVLLAFLTGGIAALVYLIMLIVVPQAPDGETGGAAGSRAGSMPATAPAPSAGPGPGIAPGGDETTVIESASAVGSTALVDAAPATGVTRRARTRRGGGGGGLVFGVILILVGTYFLIREYVPAIDLDLVWPVAVIVIGALLVLTAMRPGGRTGS